MGAGRYRSRILGLFYLAQPLTTVIGAPLAGWLISPDGVFGLDGWRFMFLGVGLPAIVVGVIAWFYLTDSPAKAKWLTRRSSSGCPPSWPPSAGQDQTAEHPSIMLAFKSGRVWVLGLIYFGFIYGLYALAFFLPTIIGGFQPQFGITFNFVERGLITAIPYLPAAVALFFATRHATKRGVRTGHIAIPALAGAVSIPLALYIGSPALTIAIITVTACAIFSALPTSGPYRPSS